MRNLQYVFERTLQIRGTVLVCKDSFNSADISIQTEKKPDERKKNFRVEKQICAFNYTTNQI